MITISGTVRDSAGHPLGNVFIESMNVVTDMLGPSERTAANGTYAITGLAPGSYDVCAYPVSGEGDATGGTSTTGYLDVCDDTDPSSPYDHPTLGTTPLVVQLGDEAVQDFTLPVAAAVAGRVTDTSGHGIVDVDVDQADADGNSDAGTGTGGDGSFLLTGIGPDQTTLTFVTYQAAGGASTTGYLQARVSDSPQLGQTIIVDQVLQPAAAISGTVSDDLGPLADAEVFLPDGFDSQPVETNQDGAYRVQGLTPGTITVCFSDQAVAFSTCQPSGLSTSGPPISVTLTGGQETTGIDQTLVRHARINGHITDSTGAAISDATFTSVTSDGVSRTAQASSNGTYDDGGLFPGQTSLCVTAPGYQRQCAGTPTTDGSDPTFNLPPGGAVTDNFVLQPSTS